MIIVPLFHLSRRECPLQNVYLYMQLFIFNIVNFFKGKAIATRRVGSLIQYANGSHLQLKATSSTVSNSKDYF
jgi:hypothetical protein